ncbi:MAG: BamA/TamA family outer membrane protein [Bacteroidetes bacterium]|nr:BamA/TamA family outer membrane protein [Bacteroidota bacterium]
MKGRIIKWICFVSVIILLAACNETRHLGPGQYLYTGADVNIKSSEKISRKQKNELRDQMKDLVRPKPNSSFLGIRFKLWVYNITDTPKRKGLSYWLKNKVGEPPVLASMSVLEKNRAVLQNRLENRGFFHDSVTLDTVAKNKKLKAVYTAEIGPQYKLRNITFVSDSSSLGVQMDSAKRQSLLKTGDPYDLDVIKSERERIDGRLKQRGYYYFNPDYILMIADSTVGNNQVDLRVVVKRSTPRQAKQVYSINDVVVFADYDIYSDTSKAADKSKNAEGYTIIDPFKKFRPSIFSQALMFKSGDIYNRRSHELSLNRLINLGVFKFVKVRFDDIDTFANKLNAFYYLTPTEKKSIRFQISGLTKSDDARGGLLTLSWRNRNIFRGAELFTASVYGGLERQYLGQGQNINTSKLGVDVNLYIPKLIKPKFLHFKQASSFIPKTRINIGYEYFTRSSQYTLSSAKTSFGYIWKEDIQKEHQLNILSVNFVQPTNITPAFQAQLDTNITLARSIERQFIIGPNYNFNLNTLNRANRNTNNFYFNFNLDLSSNLLGLITGANIEQGREKKIFNTPFSQYIRTEIDFRHYLTLSKNIELASRITGGIGYAYGNSNTMPFIKEFFAGGANDLRAFRARSIGPGSYYAGNRDTAFLPDQPGDIKMELNTELRFKLFSVFRWAFFADAGNVWTLRYDSARVGSQISNKFLSQVAIGVGTGLRVDISILILRLDVAVPVREPYRPENARWYFDGKNLVWNFAIGYPF